MTDLDRLLAAEFPVEDHLIYLNHAAVAPWPRRTARAVAALAEECARQGAKDYPRWKATEDALRAQCARLLHAAADDIAFTKNTSEALSFVAQGFPWQAGDGIVIPAHEFPSNRIVWEALRPRGVAVVEVDLSGSDDPEARLIAACEARTRLLSVSSVQYASGLRLDLQRLGAACRTRGIAFCVDAIQGLGVFDHDIERIQADFLMADGHKWLLGPEGVAVFYCRTEWRERLRLLEHGWHMTEDPNDFDRHDWQPARSARRFECGSPNMLGIHALAASLGLIEEVGISEIERRVCLRAEYLIRAIRERPTLTLLTDARPGRYAGIVSFRHLNIRSEAVVARLRDKGVICAARGGGVRLSPHFYTTLTNIDNCLSVIDNL